jgi:hypothetical protein
VGDSSLDPATCNRRLVGILFAAARTGPTAVARGDRVVISTHHPVSAHPGLQALRTGGTAAHALVALAALDTVVLPGTSTLAGSGEPFGWAVVDVGAAPLPPGGPCCIPTTPPPPASRCRGSAPGRRAR